MTTQKVSSPLWRDCDRMLRNPSLSEINSSIVVQNRTPHSQTLKSLYTAPG